MGAYLRHDAPEGAALLLPPVLHGDAVASAVGMHEPDHVPVAGAAIVASHAGS